MTGFEPGLSGICQLGQNYCQKHTLVVEKYNFSQQKLFRKLSTILNSSHFFLLMFDQLMISQVDNDIHK